MNIFRETVAEQDELHRASESEHGSDNSSDDGRRKKSKQIYGGSKVACKWCGTRFETRGKMYAHTRRKHLGGELFEMFHSDSLQKT